MPYAVVESIDVSPPRGFVILDRYFPVILNLIMPMLSPPLDDGNQVMIVGVITY
jgi:hypothetical protein